MRDNKEMWIGIAAVALLTIPTTDSTTIAILVLLGRAVGGWLVGGLAFSAMKWRTRGN